MIPFEPDEAWSRLLAAARRRLEQTGGALDVRIGLADPSDAERRVVIGLTGRHRPPGTGRLTVSLSELDAGLRRGHGEGLVALLCRVGGPLRDRRAEAEGEAVARDAALTALARSRHESRPWFSAWRNDIAADGTVTRLVRRGEPEVLGRARAVLDRLPAADVPLPVLAEEVTGDPKALAGTALGHLVLRALALRAGSDPPSTAQERRELWENAGVVVDDLASQVLVLNLSAVGSGPEDAGREGAGLGGAGPEGTGLGGAGPEGTGLGGWLSDAARRGIPLRVTLQQLTAMPIAPAAPDIFVCENPAVLRQAATQLGARGAPLICTEGVPSLACWRLLEAATGAVIHWHNDFDWAGLRMTQSAVERLGALPWRMTADDYRAALALGDTEPLRGPAATSPWDPDLAVTLGKSGRSVMEERLVAALLTDLKR